MPTARYRLFEGPGHAWLEVPVSEVTPDTDGTAELTDEVMLQVCDEVLEEFHQ